MRTATPPALGAPGPRRVATEGAGMRTRPQQLAAHSLITLAWGAVTLSTVYELPERLHESIIGAAICITVCIAIGNIAIGNRRYYHRDLDILRTEVEDGIKASRFGGILDGAEMPFRPAVPDGPVHSVPITGENAIVGVRKGVVVDLDAVRDAIRHTES